MKYYAVWMNENCRSYSINKNMHMHESHLSLDSKYIYEQSSVYMIHDSNPSKCNYRHMPSNLWLSSNEDNLSD